MVRLAPAEPIGFATKARAIGTADTDNIISPSGAMVASTSTRTLMLLRGSQGERLPKTDVGQVCTARPQPVPT